MLQKNFQIIPCGIESEDTAILFYPAYCRACCIDAEGQSYGLIFPVINDQDYANGVFATQAIAIK